MLLVLTISTAEVSAEQAAAEQYRQMFRSGNFYVECRMSRMFRDHEYSSGVLTYAGEDGKRMQRTTRKGLFSSGSASMFESADLGDFYAEEDQTPATSHYEQVKNKKWPDYLYRDGQYYHFISSIGAAIVGNKIDVFAKVLPEDQINSSALNPKEGFQYARRELALPDELAVFYWDDPFRDNRINLPAPRFNGSSTRTVKDKTYDCDQYVNDIKSMDGNVIAQEVYNMLYSDGKLVMIQKCFLRDGNEHHILNMDIISLTAEVPESAFAIDKKIKVYAAHNGDLNDLVGKEVLVGEIGGKKK